MTTYIYIIYMYEYYLLLDHKQAEAETETSQSWFHRYVLLFYFTVLFLWLFTFILYWSRHGQSGHVQVKFQCVPSINLSYDSEGFFFWTTLLWFWSMTVVTINHFMKKSCINILQKFYFCFPRKRENNTMVLTNKLILWKTCLKYKWV